MDKVPLVRASASQSDGETQTEHGYGKTDVNDSKGTSPAYVDSAPIKVFVDAATTPSDPMPSRKRSSYVTSRKQSSTNVPMMNHSFGSTRVIYPESLISPAG